MIVCTALCKRTAQCLRSAFLHFQCADIVVTLPANVRLYGLTPCIFKYRNSRTGGRSTRIQIDHDVFEGLPVRHWRKRPLHVSAVLEKGSSSNTSTRNLIWPELSMPRDAHLLSSLSQRLLRAARTPQARKSTAPLMEDEREAGEDDDAEGDVDVRFFAKRWAVMPKDVEGPEPEFLAKRRKGLPSVHGAAIDPLGGTGQMRKTKIRKVDTEGNSFIWEVFVPEGQMVDGELFEEEEASPTQIPAPGTVVDGMGMVNAEGVVIAGDQVGPAVNRRRPPPPKRKAKGPSRGKKKKVAFVLGVDGASNGQGINSAHQNSETLTNSNQVYRSAQGTQGDDIEMGDDSMLQDGEEGSEEGSEGQEGEEVDGEEGELSLSPGSSKSPTSVAPPAIIESLSEPQATSPQASVPVDQMVIEPATSSSNVTKFQSLDERKVEPMTEPLSEATQEPFMDSMAATTSRSLEEPKTRLVTTPTKTQPIAVPAQEHSRTSVGESFGEPTIASLYDFVGKHTRDTLDTSGTGPVAAPFLQIAESSHQPAKQQLVEPIIESKPSPTLKTSKDFVEEEPTAVSTENPLSQPSAEATMELSMKDTIDHPTVATSKPTSEYIVEPTMEAVAEPTVEVKLGPIEDTKEESGNQRVIDQNAKSMEVPFAKPIDEAMCENLNSFSVTPDTIATPSEALLGPTTQAQPDAVSDARSPASQHQPEAASLSPSSQPRSETETFPPDLPMQAQSETNFSYQSDPMNMGATNCTAKPDDRSEETITEPTVAYTKQEKRGHIPDSAPKSRTGSWAGTSAPISSPKAPTPSPPTPIETASGMQGPPYQSPKAPTMSPPTPVAREISSSPDLPLAAQNFQLPPHMNTVSESTAATAPGMAHIPAADRLEVEAAPSVNPQLEAQIPVEHDPLDGLAAPRTTNRPERQVSVDPPRFPDGEEDLLGRLERSL